MGGGVITVAIFDKMSCLKTSVKIKSGMVRLLIPCVYVSRIKYKLGNESIFEQVGTFFIQSDWNML